MRMIQSTGMMCLLLWAAKVSIELKVKVVPVIQNEEVLGCMYRWASGGVEGKEWLKESLGSFR